MTIHLCNLPGSVCRRAAFFLLDLAPSGVYLAVSVARDAGALLPHLFTLTSLLRLAVCFLWHFPASHLDWLLASTYALWSPDLPQFAKQTAAIQPTLHHAYRILSG